MDEIDISIVIPAYKESERIRSTLERINQYFKGKKRNYEIIVVNDGSPDDTMKVLIDCQTRYEKIKILDNGVNRGKGYSVRSGMLMASGKYRLFMDADNSVDIGTLDAFLEDMKESYDIVIGSIAVEGCKVKEENGWHRRVFGSFSKWLIRALATPGIYDTQRGFKLFTARAANIVFSLQSIDRFGFDIELLVISLKNNLRIKERAVEFNNPDGSTVKLIDYIRTFNELFKILINRTFGKYDLINYNRPRPV